MVIRLQLMAGLALLIMLGGLAGFGHGLVAGFAVLNCLLVGAELLLPNVLSACLTFPLRLSRALVAWSSLIHTSSCRDAAWPGWPAPVW